MTATAFTAPVEATPFERYLSYFLVFYFASGTLAHLLPAVVPITRYITDLLLFVSNGLIVYALWRRHADRRLLVWLIAAYWFTFATEAVGVATGAIFGEYAYGETMWLQWLGVPFAIAFNWCVLTLACNDLAGRIYRAISGGGNDRDGFLLRSVLVALFAGVGTALYDVAIEPVAIALDYWTWAAGDIPLQNYLAWALVAFLISLPLQLLRIRFESPVLPVYLFGQLFFFLALNALL